MTYGAKWVALITKRRKKKMNKKIFFCSDIHGEHQILLDALAEAGFDEQNPDHLLVVLGDINDRGFDFLNLYRYLKELCDDGKAIVTSGNHHLFLIEFLEGNRPSYCHFNYKYNGLNQTIADLWHRTAPFESWLFENEHKFTPNTTWESAFYDFQQKCAKDINEEYPDLLPWLKNMPRYFESKNYIGVHASLDLYAKDWHNPNKKWEDLEFDDGSFICRKNNTGKTIVVGHFDTGSLRSMWQIDSKDKNDHSILKTNDNEVFIDGCVALTKTINIFIVEDELL